MKIIYNNIIPVKGFSAINLFGVVFARKEFNPLSRVTINHEQIHWEQMLELLFFGFYVWYFLEWLFRIAQYRNLKEAYRNISFEREARKNETNLKYTEHRVSYSFFKYLGLWT